MTKMDEYDRLLDQALEGVDPETRRIVREMQRLNKEMFSTYMMIIKTRHVMQQITIINAAILGVSIGAWLVYFIWT